MQSWSLLVRATLAIYASALQDSGRALVRHIWIIGLVPAYTLLLQLVLEVARGLGFLGGFLVFLAVAACASSFLALIGDAVAHQRIRFESMGETFGRYLWLLVSIFFVFWIIQILLSLIVAQNPNLMWLSIAVNGGIFLIFNPVPELVYQSSNDGLALLEEAVQFMRDNTIEWLLPLAVLLAPFFLIDSRTGFMVMAQLDVTNALDLAIAAIAVWMPNAPFAMMLATLIASLAIVWAMLFRGFLFRALARSGRRQRIFDARVRGL